MSLFYDFIYIVLFVFYAPVLLLKGKLHKGYLQRFGMISPDLITRLKGKRNIWFHSVSVGEVLALVSLIKKVKKEYPDFQIVLSTVTKTGQALARQTFEGDVVLYAPMDLSLVLKKFIKLIDPKVYIAAETEIWPNLYNKLYKKGVPLLQVNGRISDQSFKGYHLFKRLLQNTLSRVALFCMQSDQDAKRIIEIGALEDRVKVTGNIKFDNLPENADVDKSKLGYKRDDKILIAGSTHPNEEEILLKIFNRLKNEDASLRLMISPRHVERSGDVAEIIKGFNLKPALLSQLKGKPLSPEDVLLVDRIGVLKDLYSIASFVFIGKTLAVGGGQNMIEPAFFGKPTFVGPMTYNFKDVVRIFLSEEALIQVEDEAQLHERLAEMLKDKSKAESVGKRSAEVVRKYQGATKRTLEYIRPFID